MTYPLWEWLLAIVGSGVIVYAGKVITDAVAERIRGKES